MNDNQKISIIDRILSYKLRQIEKLDKDEKSVVYESLQDKRESLDSGDDCKKRTNPWSN